MNLKALNLKWALAFAGAAAVGAAGVVLVLTLMGGSDQQATAQPADPTATPLATLPSETVEATVPPGPGEGTDTPITPGPKPTLPSYPVVVPALPKGLVTGEKRPCPEGWRRISDDEANYSFCLPPGWGMVDHETGQARADAVMHWESAAILSPEAFPYPYLHSYENGIRDLIRDSEKDIIWMQLFFIRAENEQSMSCDAKASQTLGGLPSASCENKFTIPPGTDQAMPDPEGKWERLFVVVPLPNAQTPPELENSPYPTPEGGYSFALGILFEGRTEASAHYHDVIMQILDTLEGQP
jgi:hypothetical protein